MVYAYNCKTGKCNSCTEKNNLAVIETKKENSVKKIVLCKDCLKMLKLHFESLNEYNGIK